ncbi:MAG: Glyoxalase family protein [Alphaproteobacteria bacterium]|nr:Glyoxalase family protein [Alphaproteobacteria bacterium]
MSKTPSRPNIFPALKYQNAKSAIDFLNKAFGFSTAMSYPGEGEKIVHAELKLGAGTIMLGSDTKNPDNPWDAVRIGIYVQIDDVDAHYVRAKAAGARIVRPLASTEYGAREYSAYDSEDNLWSFGTYHPDAAEK